MRLTLEYRSGYLRVPSPLLLERDNRFLYLRGGVPKSVLSQLDAVTSYKVAGYFWSKQFRAGYWDGAEHLLKFDRKTGVHKAPVGLLPEVVAELERLKVRYSASDCGVESRQVDYSWNAEIRLRKYQLRAIHAVRTAAILPGCGIIKLPIRAGKTKTAAGLIAVTGVPAAFIVPSLQLLEQSHASLSESLGGHVGIVGDSQFDWNPNGANVVSIHTLVSLKKRKDKRYKQITEGVGQVIFDECHHLTGDSWHGVMMDFTARYRVGLSATAFPERSREHEKGAIWMKAICGPIRIDVTISELIRDGYLVRPTIHLYDVREPNKMGRGWSKKLQDECINLNPTRNAFIAEQALKFAADGNRVIIATNRLNQLSDLMSRLGSQAQEVVGGTPLHERRERIESFVAKRPPILVGTVFGEGVDIPEVEVLINAEGGRDDKATIQRLRNLTPAVGKTEAIVIDFIDNTNKYFKQHSRAREKLYKSEPEFKVVKMGAI